jgi:hypothetical protein
MCFTLMGWLSHSSHVSNQQLLITTHNLSTLPAFAVLLVPSKLQALYQHVPHTHRMHTALLFSPYSHHMLHTVLGWLSHSSKVSNKQLLITTQNPSVL